MKLARKWKPRYVNPRYAGTRCTFFTNVVYVFYDFIFHTSEIRTVFLEVGIDL